MLIAKKNKRIHSETVRDISICLAISFIGVILLAGFCLLWDAQYYLPKSDADHGATIDSVIAGFRDEDYGHAAFFTKHGFKVLEETQYSTAHISNHGDTSTFFQKWNIPFVAVYNRPDSSSLSFSVDDLYYLAANSCCKKLIAVEPSRTISLELDKSEAWPSYVQINDFLCDYVNKDAYKAVNNGYIVSCSPWSASIRLGGDYATTDELLYLFASVFGLSYKVTDA